MNELSWFIYLADVVGGLKAASAAGAIVGVIALAAFTFGKLIAMDTGYGEPVTPSLGTVYKKSIPFILAFAVVGLLTPSQHTIYAIAASEVGDRVITSETGGKAIEALNVWLDAQINKGAEKKETN